MAKVELKGIVKQVTKPETVGDNGTRKQSIILFVPGYVDAFGDKKGDDEEWQIDLFNKKIDDLNLNNNIVDKKAIIIAYVGSKKLQNRDGKDIFIINANLGDMKILDGSNQNNQRTANTASNW